MTVIVKKAFKYLGSLQTKKNLLYQRSDYIPFNNTTLLKGK